MTGRADAEALLRFEAFRRGESGERLFRHPTCHPSQPTGFCPCDGSPAQRHLFYLKAALLDATLKLPYDGPKIRLLRWLGATIGERVVIAAGTWIDPTFPDLLTIEDDVMIGVQAKIALHEFRAAEFLAGRTTIRKGAVIGGFPSSTPRS